MVHSLNLSIENKSPFQALLTKYFHDKECVNVEEFFKKLGIDKDYLDQLAYYQAMEKDAHEGNYVVSDTLGRNTK